MNTPPRRPDESPMWYLFKNFTMGATAACIAELITLPIDTAKVRMQIQERSLDPNHVLKYNGFVGTTRTMIMEEGFTSLYQGLAAGV